MKGALALAALIAPSTAWAAPTLSPVWQDHAVIQRGAPVLVEGRTVPGGTVTATLGTATATSKAAKNGTFALTFPARTASAEPVVLTVSDSTGSTTVSDIVVGDVWLCSGQSNMAWTVAAGLNGYNNIQVSADPLLRMLTVPLDTSAKPSREFGGAVAWQRASPETTGNFSAACYYMLKDLRAKLGIPVGAVHSSWGGSQARAWLSPESGRALFGAEQMALLDNFEADPLSAVKAFAPEWEAWWRRETGKSPWADPSSMTWRPVPQIAPWTNWGDDAPPAIGNVWFRRSVDLTATQAAAGAELNIGIIDDLDATWVNGRAVGMTHGWSKERIYRIPAEYLREGPNEIVFSANNTWGAGGMQSEANRLSLTTAGERIPLAEGWLYAVGEFAGSPPRAPWDANAGIGLMHNRMIAPIGRFAMAGAAWYQGESDVGIPGYEDRLRELFAGWRRQFGGNMKMLVVQLADFGDRSAVPTTSGWAETRDEQRQAVAADANAALVSAIDLGEPTDIHPANKVDLGKRLALAAQGQAMPMPVAGRIDGDNVIVSFSGVEGGLKSLSGRHPLAVELCAETQESCRFVIAALDTNRMIIRSDGKAATRVRYAWSDAPIVNLYDGRGLPVPGFELPIVQ
ncbi:MAG: sialate O-acetylesterase [Tsuneonella sp.]